MATLTQLQQRLGYKFREESLLRLAITHPSVAHDAASALLTNQRLEFLGDAALQLVLTHELYERFPEQGEGALTKARAGLVNRRTLAALGRELELGKALIISRGEDMHGGRERASSLADAFEAILGAVFVDGGFEQVRAVVVRQFEKSLDEVSVLPGIENPKGELQELLQSTSNTAPRYSVASTSGPDHDRQFECTVHHQGAELARGRGKSKKEAESQAALQALEFLKSQPQGEGDGAPRQKMKPKQRSRKAAHENSA